MILARLDSILQPVDGGPFNHILLLLSQPVDTELLATTDATTWMVDSHLELAGLVADREIPGQHLVSQIDPSILAVACAAPLNPHAELSLTSGAAGLGFVGGGRLDLVDQPIASATGLASGAVRGLVIDSAGALLAGAEVELYEWVNASTWLLGRSDRTRTDSNGEFVFDAVRWRDDQVPLRYASFLIRAAGWSICGPVDWRPSSCTRSQTHRVG